MHDYDIDINIPVTLRLANGETKQLQLNSSVISDSTLDRIFQDIDQHLEDRYGNQGRNA